MIPVLIKPQLWAIKNRWCEAAAGRQSAWGDFLIAALSFMVMYGIFVGVQRGVGALQKVSHLIYLAPSLPISVLLLALFFVLLFSNFMSALSSFYLGKDLDLILASPLHPRSFFLGRFVDVLGGSSWMVVIFCLPALLAFGTAYQAGSAYYMVAALALLPFFLLPCAVGICLATLFVKLVPPSRSREIMLLCGLLAVAALFLLTRVIDPGATSLHNSKDMLKILTLISSANVNWLPSYWAASGIASMLEAKPAFVLPSLFVLYACTAAATSLAYMLVCALHGRSYSNSRSAAKGISLDSRRAQDVLALCTPFIASPYRAVIGKELKLFARDMTQAVQLMLLIALCTIYLYNFRLLSSVEGLPAETRMWWQSILVLANIAMGAFVITAVCTRFVFPSVSLEGLSFWIVQVSPLSLSGLLRAKFWCWLVPVATISSTIFAAGALAIDAEMHIVAINAIASWVVCYGVVGLAIGLGAYFAHFTWEHTSQLSASFGSLIFMIVSTALIFVNIIPSGLLIGLRTLRNLGFQFSTGQWYLAVALCAVLLIYINYAAARWALRLGENSLRERMKK